LDYCRPIQSHSEYIWFPDFSVFKNSYWLLKLSETLLNRRPSGATHGLGAGIGGRSVHCFVSILLVGECGYEDLRFHSLVELDGRI